MSARPNSPRVARRETTLPFQLGVAALFLSIGVFAMLVYVSSTPAAPPDFDEECRADWPWLVGSIYMAQSGDSPRLTDEGASLVLFRDTPDDWPHYSLATMEQTGALWGVGYSREEGAVYASAYHKRYIPFGPSGPGAIYRIDLATGGITTAIIVPDAGRDLHDPPGKPLTTLGPDDSAEWVGKTSLGDLEIAEQASELLVMNLADRRIHRFRLPGGEPLGSFPHGAASEGWATTARPFGLTVIGDELLHGVVNSNGIGSSFVATVYRSALDGAGMREVARVPLDYPRGRALIRTPLFDGRYDLSWSRWLDISDSTRWGELRGAHSMPMLTDLAITSDGSLGLAFRDRRWDMLYGYFRSTRGVAVSIADTGIGFGDLLHGVPSPGGWRIETDPEHYDDESSTGFPESALGGLAVLPVDPSGLSPLVAGASGVDRDLILEFTGLDGAYWYSPETGAKLAHEAVAAPASIVPYSELIAPPDLAFADNEGDYLIGSLGDIEALCSSRPSTPAPTPTGSATLVSTPVPVDTLTPVPSATATPTLTSTPISRPIYLPLTLTEHCDPTRVRADIALVLDASSSMTGAKLAAAKSAAIAFVRAMRLPEDQVGIAAFNREARIVHPLSVDRASLESAIDEIEVSPGTRIDRGLGVGLDVLEDARSGPDITPLLVLLTDGIQETDPEAPSIVSDRVRAAGITMHVIGLGDDVDAVYLRSLVETDDLLHLSPGPGELEAIYTEVALAIPCSVESYWGRR